MTKSKPIKLYNTKDMPRKEWLMRRKEGLGGSDAASLAGLNKYSSPLEVYINKTEPELVEKEYNEKMEWGNRAEPIIFKKFRENHPEWRIQKSYFMWKHPVHEFMLANVDGLIFDPQRGWGVLEIKNVGEFLKDEWGEVEAPEHYVIQLQHYLEVLGLNWGYFAILIGGNTYKEFYVERNNELIDALISIEKDFWFNHVLKGVPPLPDGSDSAEEILGMIYPASSALPMEEVLELESSTIDLINEFDEIKDQIKELEKRKKEISQLIQVQVGDYQSAVCQDRKITYKASRSFNEEELKKSEPEIYKNYSKSVLDKNRFKKDLPKVYDKFMLPTDKRSLTIK